MAYEGTTVPVEKSQGEIRSLLMKHGATGFAFGEETSTNGLSWAMVQFQHQSRRVRLRVLLKPVDQNLLARKYQRARSRSREDIERELVEQEAKRIWRVMAWNLKARMVAVTEGVETFEEAFLAHLLDERTGETIYEQLVNTGSVQLSAPLLQLEVGS